ncbi:hypothetical protein NBRC116588_12880 [Pyruvatibacter sp. HU-CL02332]|uniref:ImmA/IrrE family metallo-endopeptidase n=1 Tax=Pyruvatibacter sp. HU-CL02332 TaxID=3127650 RepID=UPI003102CF37
MVTAATRIEKLDIMTALSHEVPEYPAAEATQLSKSSIYSLAEDIARQLDYKPGSEISNAVAKLGGSIEVHNFRDDPSSNPESMIVEEPGKFKIYISPDTSVERDNFTIAHELGHYVLHFLWQRHKGKQLERMAANRFGSNRVEWEANWFAAAFLMPEKEFRAAWQKSGNASLVAREFGVSTSAADTRAKALTLAA